jgi:hypothetical protein
VGWNTLYPSSTTRSKVQERLRGFLRYCLASNLITRVPILSPIQVTTPPTLPLTEGQYKKLLAEIPDEFSETKAWRVHAFVRLMRHSGLAIRDAVTLERIELRHDKHNGLYRVVTSRQKTGTHVSVPIPSDVAEEVLSVMKLNESPQYIFWNSGTGTERTVVTNWQHDIKQTFTAAGMPDGRSRGRNSSAARRVGTSSGSQSRTLRLDLWNGIAKNQPRATLFDLEKYANFSKYFLHSK